MTNPTIPSYQEYIQANEKPDDGLQGEGQGADEPEIVITGHFKGRNWHLDSTEPVAEIVDKGTTATHTIEGKNLTAKVQVDEGTGRMIDISVRPKRRQTKHTAQGQRPSGVTTDVNGKFVGL